MKKIIAYLMLSITVVACGGEKAGDKTAELEKLLKEQAKLNERIRTLKDEIRKETGSVAGTRLVEMKSLTPQSFTNYVDIQAKVDGNQSVALSARTQGTVRSINVKVGDKVYAGQVLAVMDDVGLSGAYAEISTQYSFAKEVYEKQKSLWEQQVGSEMQYLQAKNNMMALQKRLNATGAQLDLSRIKAPVSGTVDAVNIKIGQAVMPGMPAISVVNLSSLKVTGNVGESLIGKVNTGDPVMIYFPDLKKEVPSKLSYASRRSDQRNRTFSVEAPLDSLPGAVSPNLVAVLKIADYKSDSALVVPVDLIQRSSDGQYVMLGENRGGKMVATRKKISIGRTYGGATEVLTGITSKDQVIVNGYRDLNEGEEIRTK
ncbi:MAG: efflux RND transporter periplasmic adaptor subunit [Bacteroidota bacterium]